MSVKRQFEPKGRVFVCTYEKDGKCRIGEGEKCASWLKGEIKSCNLKKLIKVTRTKCQGYCDKKGTAVTFAAAGLFQQYSAVRLNEFIVQVDEFIKIVKENGSRVPGASDKLDV